MDIRDRRDTLELLEVKILTDPPIYKSSEVPFVGCLNGFFIFPYHYYWVVRGKMPLKYADELYQYRDVFGVRVNGGTNDNKPIDHCTSDEYDEYLQKMVKLISTFDNIEEMCAETQKKKQEMMDEDIDKFYVDMYHIDTNQGLKRVVDIIRNNNIKTEWY